MLKSTGSISLFILSAVAIVSCSDKKELPQPIDPVKKTQYVFVARSEGDGAANYILKADDVASGIITTQNNGVEDDGYSFITVGNELFAMDYTEAGAVRPYKLNEQGLITSSGPTVNAAMTGAYGVFNNNSFVGGDVNRGAENPVAVLYRYDAEKKIVANRNTVNMFDVLNGVERGVWNGIFQVDNKVYIPLVATPGVSGQSTMFVDSSWIAVFSYPELNYGRTIRDGRTGPIGNWFGMHGIQQIENGDVYAWSTAGGRTGLPSKNPSAVIRIKKGQQEFDEEYFFNIEAASGSKIARADYIRDGKFLATLYATAVTGSVSGGRVKLAVIDVLNKTVQEVSGVPEHNQMSYKNKVYNEGNGVMDYVMKDDTGKFVIYVIDTEKHTGTRGAEFQGVADVTTISKLSY